jgi:hypothetical protein
MAEHQPVKSSNVESVSFHDGVLEVKFNGGGHYAFHGGSIGGEIGVYGGRVEGHALREAHPRQVQDGEEAMSDVVELVYGAGITGANIASLKPGYVVVEGVRPPPEVDGMKTPVADLERATRNCALHRVVHMPRDLLSFPGGAVDVVGARPDGAVSMQAGDLVRVRHEHLEQLDVCERGLCAINALHVLAVLKSAAP